MAAREIKTTLALDGEKQFKAGMDDAYRAMKVLGSEMKLNTAEFGNNAKSMDGLVAKQKTLGDMQRQQREIVAALTKAVQESAQAYGETDKRTDAYRIKLNNAEASLKGIENQLGQTNDDIQNFGQQTDVASKKTVDWQKVLGDVNTSLDKNIQGYTAALAAIGAFVGGVIAAGKQVFDATVEMGKFADELITTSMQTGISTQSLQQWTYAAQFIDTEVETMTGAMAKMIRQMASAQQGTEKSALAFSTLGVNITDSSGKLLDSEAVFFAAIDALGKVANETERDALAMQIFGKSAQELNPLIIAGSEQLRALGIEAQNLGVVMSDSTVTAFGAFDDSMNVMNGTIQSVKNNFLTAMLPAMETISSTVQGLATKFNEWLKTDGAQALLKTLTDKVSNLATNLGDNLTPIVESVIAAFDTVTNTIGWVIDNIGLLKTIAIALTATLVTLKIAQIAVNLAMATNPIGLLVTAIGLVVAAAVTLIMSWGDVKAALLGAWESIKSAFSAGVAAVGGFIGNIVTSLGSMVTSAWEAGKNLVSGIWRGIQSSAQWLADQVTGWLSGMWTGIKNFFGIKSPSKLMADTIGKPMAQGIALGLGKNLSLVGDELNKINPMLNMNVSGKAEQSVTANFSDSALARIVEGLAAVISQRDDMTIVLNDREFGRAVRKVAIA